MTESIRCCPQCGSPAVDYSLLTGGQASCRGCFWGGKAEDLLNISAAGLDSTGRTIELMNDLRSLMSRNMGQPLLTFLIKWGFLDVNPNDIIGTLDRRIFSKYLAAIAAGVLKAIIETKAATVEGVNHGVS